MFDQGLQPANDDERDSEHRDLVNDVDRMHSALLLCASAACKRRHGCCSVPVRMSASLLVRFQVPLPKDKRAELAQAAAEQGISSADFARRCIYKALRDRKPS